MPMLKNQANKNRKTTGKDGTEPARPTFDHPSTAAIFFFKDEEVPYGCFCQWYRSRFQDPGSGLTFSSAEQWMMWNKAKMAGDEDSMHLIIKTASPRKQKQMGRDVKGFDPAEWDKIKFDVVVRGNMMKFSQGDTRAYQNLEAGGVQGSEAAATPLREILLGTGTKYLCEASRFDRVWGIGYAEDQAGQMSRSKWGENLLGRALCVVRDRLREEHTEMEA